MLRTLDFNTFAAGTVIDDEYKGVAISATGGSGQAMIFDSANPTGGDTDLASDKLGGLLIISEDGKSANPDDNAASGTISFDFDNLVKMKSITLKDIEETSGAGTHLNFYDVDGTLIKTQIVDPTEDNGETTVDFFVPGTARFEVVLSGSGAIDNVTFDDPHFSPEKGDGIVSNGDEGALIDTSYDGDPEGDFIDNGDALLPGEAPQDDIVDAQGGDDTIYSGLGDDDVYAGAGDDVVKGGAGDDIIYGDSEKGGATGGTPTGPNLIENGSFEDTTDLTATGYGFVGEGALPGWTETNGAQIDVHADGRGNVDASDGDNWLDLSASPSLGAVGQDVSGVKTGQSYQLAFDAADGDGLNGGENLIEVYWGGELIDTIDPATSDMARHEYTVKGGAGDGTNRLEFRGQGGNDNFGASVDNVSLVALTPTVITGNDVLNGEDGDDLIFGEGGDDTLIGGQGDDSLRGGTGNDVLNGGIGDDILRGGRGDDVLDGGDGDDNIRGGAGADSFMGGAGNDTMIGGRDQDTFRGVNAGDVIDGSSTGIDEDTLDLRGSAPAGGRLEITYTSTDEEDGFVTYFDADDNVLPDVLVFEEIETIVPCFTPGTRIATPSGERRVEELRVGDRVITRDNGIQEIRWVGQIEMSGVDLERAAHLKPVLIRQGALGNDLPERDMMVSPNHRVLVANDKTALYFEEREVLVAAKHLTGLDGVDIVDVSHTTYIHIMFEQHEVVLSDGTWTESFQPGAMTLAGVGNAQRDEILELFPELATSNGVEAYASARRSLKKYEAQLLTK